MKSSMDRKLLLLLLLENSEKEYFFFLLSKKGSNIWSIFFNKKKKIQWPEEVEQQQKKHCKTTKDSLSFLNVYLSVLATSSKHSADHLSRILCCLLVHHCWIQSTNEKKICPQSFQRFFFWLLFNDFIRIKTYNLSKRIEMNSKKKQRCMYVEGWIRWIPRKIKFNWIELKFIIHSIFFLHSIHTECISLPIKWKHKNIAAVCLKMSVRLYWPSSLTSVSGHSVQISNVGLLLLLLCHHHHHRHLIFFYPIKRSGHLVKHSYARTHQKLSSPSPFNH